MFSGCSKSLDDWQNQLEIHGFWHLLISFGYVFLDLWDLLDDSGGFLGSNPFLATFRKGYCTFSIFQLRCDIVFMNMFMKNLDQKIKGPVESCSISSGILVDIGKNSKGKPEGKTRREPEGKTRRIPEISPR